MEDQKQSIDDIIQEIKLHEHRLNSIINTVLTEYPELKIYTKGQEDKECSLRYGLQGSNEANMTIHLKVGIHKALTLL